MSSTNPITRDLRERTIELAAGQTVITFDFRIYDLVDVAVFWKEPTWTRFKRMAQDFTVTAPTLPGVFTVTLATAFPSGTKLRVQSRRLPERITDVTMGGTISAAALEDELDRQSTVGQELRRDADALSELELELDETIILVDEQVALATAAASAAGEAVVAVGLEVEAAQALLEQTEDTIGIFTEYWLGALAANPTLAPSGGPLLDGSLYWNTIAKEFRVYDGATGLWASAPVPGAIVRYQTFIATVAGQTLFPISGGYSPGPFSLVCRNGVMQTAGVDVILTSGTNIEFPPGVVAESDEIAFWSFGSFAIGNALVPANNLSEVVNITAARTNLGVYSKAESEAIAGGNRVVNGGFEYAQRTLGSLADGVYSFDQYVNLCTSGSVTVSQQADPETGALFGARMLQPDATAKRMGLMQPLEARNAKELRTTLMTFAGRARLSIAGTIRFAILEHTGTADAITRDVVNNWASTTYTPGNFFIAGVSVLASGSLALAANTWSTFTVSGTPTGACNNLLLFVWTDAAVAQNVTLDFNRWRLNPGATALPFRPAQDDWEQCLRFCEFPVVVRSIAYSSSAVNHAVGVRFAKKRIAPTFYFTTDNNTLSNVTSVTIDQITTTQARALIAITAAGLYGVDRNYFVDAGL